MAKSASFKTGTLDFKAMFDAYAGATQKQWAHDRSQSVGASEVFGCIRSAWFKKRGEQFGFKQDVDFVQSWGATKRGDLIENYLVVPALDYGLQLQAPSTDLLYAGEEQNTLVKGRASATPDGLVVGLPKHALALYGVDDIESDSIVTEIKSVDPRTNLQEEKATHRGQVQMQMGLIRELTNYRPVYAAIIYVDASFHDTISVFVVKYDEKVYLAGKKRAENVFEIDDPAKLAPEGKFDNACTYCAFQDACALVSIGRVPAKDERKKLPIDDDAELAELIEAFSEKSAEKKRAEHDYEVVKEAIKARMQERNVSRVWGEGFKVSWITQKGRKTLDRDALEADGIDLSKYEKEGVGFDVLKVSLSE